MRRISLFLALLGFLFLTACQNGASKGKNNNASEKTMVSSTAHAKPPVMTFPETVHNFGRMVQGEVGKYDFHFKNTGESNLVINGVQTTCGCTVGNYPHYPVKPGEEGNIEVTFNSSFKQGYQDKGIMILANTNPGRIVLNIKALVVLPKHNK